MRTRHLVCFALALASVLVGCAGPTVHITHALPAAVNLPPGDAVQAGRFQAVGEGSDWTADVLKAEVARQFADLDAADNGAARIVTGSVTVEATDERGTRSVRRRDPSIADRADHALVTVALPSLIRHVRVRTVLAVAAAGHPAPVRLEVRKTYDSTRDPRVRSPDGLRRGDDPEHVPPTGQIIRELLRRCVETARSMVEPLNVPVTLTFRAGGGEDADAGRRAAGEGDFVAAAEHFRTALAKRPDAADLRLNLAAACEAAGEFAAAERHYRAVWKASNGHDDEARAGASRAEMLQQHITADE
ncbi:MAG: tetratricopeptide repeat protein [Phycisphaerae bacterium]|nr:tetratricopeptide repeat protein [Phycisphaerae bacterium]